MIIGVSKLCKNIGFRCCNKLLGNNVDFSNYPCNIKMGPTRA